MDQQVISEIRSYAKANYNRDGWDVLVECWEDEDIAKAAGKATTLEGALRNVRSVLKTINDYREDIEGTAF